MTCVPIDPPKYEAALLNMLWYFPRTAFFLGYRTEENCLDFQETCRAMLPSAGGFEKT
jgi:hypothetical protein